jgi:hypothetical protein
MDVSDARRLKALEEEKQQAKDGAQVGLRIEAVELGGLDERVGGSGRLGRIVARTEAIAFELGAILRSPPTGRAGPDMPWPSFGETTLDGFGAPKIPCFRPELSLLAFGNFPAP